MQPGLLTEEGMPHAPLAHEPNVEHGFVPHGLQPAGGQYGRETLYEVAGMYTGRYVVYGTNRGKMLIRVTGRYAVVGQPLHGSLEVTTR